MVDVHTNGIRQGKIRDTILPGVVTITGGFTHLTVHYLHNAVSNDWSAGHYWAVLCHGNGERQRIWHLLSECSLLGEVVQDRASCDADSPPL
eukprot:11458309-Karenia_brevis.AAC.1